MHDIRNPPLDNRGSSIKLSLINTQGKIKFTNENYNKIESIYSIILSNPNKHGLISSEDNLVERFIDALVLSLNLLLSRGCITRAETKKHSFKLNNDISEPNNFVKREVNMTNVHLFESIDIHDSISTTVITNDEVDELKIFDLLEKIRKFNRFMEKTNPHDFNLNLSIRHYEKSMSEQILLFKFKNLYNSFEYIINVRGPDLTGVKFDNQASHMTGIPSLTIKEWREFYNRAKHTQRNSTDIKTYTEGNNNLANWVLSLRNCTKKLTRKELIKY
jgi:hypothetical protein